MNKRFQLLFILLVFFLAGNKLNAQNEFSSSKEMKDLTEFLIKAKKHSFASGDTSIVKRINEGAKEITYSSNGYVYRDRWYGNTHFSGEEIVWKNEKVIWSMNYYGFTTKSEDIPGEFGNFLKEALSRVPKEYPFRGDLYYRSNDLLYINDVEGSIDNFVGTERILNKGHEIFRLHYHGGIINY